MGVILEYSVGRCITTIIISDNLILSFKIEYYYCFCYYTFQNNNKSLHLNKTFSEPFFDYF